MANAKGLSLRGGQRPTWQSRSSRLHRGKVTGEIATAFPRLPRRFAPRNDTSGGYCGAPAPSSGLIPLCKALNERRYRRNRSVRFYRHLVRTGSAFPRLPRPLWGLAMTRQGSAAMGTVRHTESAVLLPLRGRAGHAPPLQGQYGFNGGRCESAMPSRDCRVGLRPPRNDTGRRHSQVCHCEAPQEPWQSRSTGRNTGKPPANSQLPSRDCRVGLAPSSQ